MASEQDVFLRHEHQVFDNPPLAMPAGVGAALHRGDLPAPWMPWSAPHSTAAEIGRASQRLDELRRRVAHSVTQTGRAQHGRLGSAQRSMAGRVRLQTSRFIPTAAAFKGDETQSRRWALRIR
jgi:hypothetical protein